MKLVERIISSSQALCSIIQPNQVFFSTGSCGILFKRMKMQAGGHRFLGSHHQKCLIFGMWYLKYILRCCTEFFFSFFSEIFRILELENWEFEKKMKKKFWNFFVPISVLPNWNHNLGISEHCLEIFLAKKSFLNVFLLRLHEKIEKITRVPPCEKFAFKKFFSIFSTYCK